MIPPPPRSTLTYTLFPYTTLVRSKKPNQPQRNTGIRRSGNRLQHISNLPEYLRYLAFLDNQRRRYRQDVPGVAHHQPLVEALRKYLRSPRSRRSEEHTSELQSLMRTSYAVFCLKQKNKQKQK